MSKACPVYNRRKFFHLLGLSYLASQLSATARTQSLPDNMADQILKPPKLKVGDTVGLINPASPVDLADVEYTEKALNKLGLKVKRGTHILDEYGYLAGKDRDRAADIHAMFADDSVKALLTLRGGWGCNRILPLLDYNLIRQNPKIILGYSDITSLLLAIYACSGIVTFHGPVGTSEWNQFSLGYCQRILFHGGTVKMVNPVRISGEVIAPGKATGRIVGGNLSVLTSMVGSPYLPDWNQTILFVEEIGEDIYRIDRMLTQLKIAGILDQISGFIFAQCRNCNPGEDDEPSLTLPQVLGDIIKPLGIPAWYGSAIGHLPDKFTIPIGVPVEIDANHATIQMLEPAVIL